MRKLIHPVDRHVGGKITQAREARGLSVGQLAGRLGMTSRRLLAYEQGRSQTRLRLIGDLSHALDIPPAWFFEGLDQSGAS